MTTPTDETRPEESGSAGKQQAEPGVVLTGPVKGPGIGGSIALDLEEIDSEELGARRQADLLRRALVREYNRQTEQLRDEINSLRDHLGQSQEKNERCNATISENNVKIAELRGEIQQLHGEIRTLRGARRRMRFLALLGTAAATFGGDRIQKPGGFALGFLAILVGFSMLFISWSDAPSATDISSRDAGAAR